MPAAPVPRQAERPRAAAPSAPPDTFRGSDPAETDGEPRDEAPGEALGRQAAPSVAPVVTPAAAAAAPPAALRDAFIEEVRRAKEAFYRMTVAQANQVDVEGDRIVFSFAPARRAGKDQIEKNRTWLEPLAARVAGRRMLVVANIAEPSPAPPLSSPDAGDNAAKPQAPAGPSEDLKAEAVADPGMKTLLELMPLEIKDVERI
jgi:hypothetical protein